MLDHLSVEEIQKNINNRQISIKEVLFYYLERIEKFNKDINAIVLQKDRELLIKEAEQKDNFKNSNVNNMAKISYSMDHSQKTPKRRKVPSENTKILPSTF